MPLHALRLFSLAFRSLGINRFLGMYLRGGISLNVLKSLISIFITTQDDSSTALRTKIQGLGRQLSQ